MKRILLIVIALSLTTVVDAKQVKKSPVAKHHVKTTVVKAKPKVVPKPVVKPVPSIVPKPAPVVVPKAPFIPPKAIPLIPVLKDVINEYWPTMPMRSAIAAQIEQESCISLTHKKCWDPRAELKTSREQGVGLGQFTRAWDKQGKLRFDAVQEMVDQNPELKEWGWKNVYDPKLQLTAILIKNRINYSKITWKTDTEQDHLSFMFATYNGGSTVKDRSLCLSRDGCDPGRWLVEKSDKPYAVESFSTKSKVKQKGYGKSFYEISREYPRNILFVRRAKYIPLIEPTK